MKERMGLEKWKRREWATGERRWRESGLEDGRWSDGEAERKC